LVADMVSLYRPLQEWMGMTDLEMEEKCRRMPLDDLLILMGVSDRAFEACQHIYRERRRAETGGWMDGAASIKRKRNPKTNPKSAKRKASPKKRKTSS
jgi:hypothetical protein